MAKLLIVEDEPDILDILKETTESWGIEVYTASNITDAKKLLEQHKMRAVLSDISMPGGSGIDLLTHVRAAGNDTPFVFLTAYDDKEFLRQALQLAATDYIQKPFDIKELEKALMSVLEIGSRLEKIENKTIETPEDVAKSKKFINLLRVNSSRRGKNEAS